MNDEDLSDDEMADRTVASVRLMAEIQPLLQGQYIGVILFCLTSLVVNVLNSVKDEEKRSAMTFKIVEKIVGLKPPGARASGASTPRKPPARSS